MGQTLLPIADAKVYNSLNHIGQKKPSPILKPIFHLMTLFARREAKTRIRQTDWLKLAGEKIRRDCSYFFVCSREQIRQVENRLYDKCEPGLSCFVKFDKSTGY